MDRIPEPDSLQLEFSRAVPSLILASSSPNRKALLEAGGSHVDVFIPSTDEEKSGSTPVETVSRIADGKIKAYLCSPSYDPIRIAIAADTLVLIDGELLGKPSSEEDGWTMLRKLSGRTQTVISAAGVKLPGQDSIVLTDTADVVFRTLTDDEIGAYISTGEWQGAAGGYRLQKTGYRLVDRIDGDWTTVVGLPLKMILDFILKTNNLNKKSI